MNRRGEARFGIIWLMSGTLLVLVALLVLARYPGIFRTGVQYRAVFKSVSGLNKGDEVRYGGLPVGTVVRMDIDPSDPTRIIVAFRVKKSTPIRSDTKASITQVGLLGAPYMQLEPGTRYAAALPPGSTLPTVENPSFQDAMRRLSEFIDRTDTLLGGAERVARASPIERLDATLTRMDTLIAIATVGARTSFVTIDRTFSRVDSASVRLGALLDRSGRLLATLDTATRSAGPQLAATQREAVQSLREIHNLLADFRDAFAQEGGVNQMVRNLSVASDNVARLSERLERDPTSVLKARAAPNKPAGPKARD
ncbi:MAG TPA: MlaD family protein [Gemmatimonadaceae bacterium]|jgi:phospholipid/cholesterol/gamma-HCH transport system substrate-binding protein